MEGNRVAQRKGETQRRDWQMNLVSSRVAHTRERERLRERSGKGNH